MSNSKEMLEATVKGLQEKVDSLTKDLATKKDQLADINKPEMSGEMYDNIQGLIEEGVSQFDFTDPGNYEYSPEFDYDNKVVIGDISMHDTSYIVESIMNKIDANYKITVKE